MEFGGLVGVHQLLDAFLLQQGFFLLEEIVADFVIAETVHRVVEQDFGGPIFKATGRKHVGNHQVAGYDQIEIAFQHSRLEVGKILADVHPIKAEKLASQLLFAFEFHEVEILDDAVHFSQMVGIDGQENAVGNQHGYSVQHQSIHHKSHVAAQTVPAETQVLFGEQGQYEK